MNKGETILPAGPRLTISVETTKVRPNPDAYEVPIYEVKIETEKSSRHETFATDIEVRTFLRGTQAGSQMTGGPYLHLPLEIL